MSDDVVFSLGSINLDYRSFFLSYENAIFAYDPLVAVEIKNDLIKAYKQSRKLTKKRTRKFPPTKKLLVLSSAYLPRYYKGVLWISYKVIKKRIRLQLTILIGSTI